VAAIVTEVEGLKSVGFALKVVLRNDWDFADVILLCVVPDIWKIIEPLSSGSSSPRRKAIWGAKGMMYRKICSGWRG